MLVIDDAGSPVDVGGAQPRTVLALLLAAGGRVVTVDTLLDVLWGDEPPASAGGTVLSYISRLRRLLEPVRDRGAPATVLVREPPGYRLVIDQADVDFRRFEHRAEEGRSLLGAGRHAEAREVLAAADALWRGPAFVEFPDVATLSSVAARLEERRLAAVEDRVAADLALGRHSAVVGELTELVGRHPLREGLRAHLALALYRAGRQAEALRSLNDARSVLRDELGVDLSRPLRELEQAILAHDSGLDAATVAATSPSAAPRRDPRPPAPVDPTAAADPATAPPAGSGLVGRSAEMAQLRATLDEVFAGVARVVVIEGEPGIGKTRLAEELSVEATARGACVRWGRAFEGGAAPAFWPWLPPLRALAAARPAEAGPLSAELAALVSPSDVAQASPIAEVARFSLIEAVVQLLVEEAARQPFVLVLDDLQWADVASLDLLSAAVARLPDAALLVIVTVRELEVGRRDAVVDTLAELMRRLGTRRLHLRGLAGDATADLVAQATGTAFAGEVAAAIHQRAEGNPFFTTELARLVASGDDLLSADVPSGVRDVVRRRLAHVPPGTLDLLQVAAAVGRDADIGLVARAAERDLAECLDDLEPALVHRLLVPVEDQPGVHRFAHALVREVLVEDLSPLRRARLHLRVADALDDRDDLAEIVAEHLWSAVPIGVGARAAAALERAAQVAVRRMAYASAQSMLERAVQLRRASGEDAAHDYELAALLHLVAVIGASQGFTALVGSPLIQRGKELARPAGHGREFFNLLWTEWAGLDIACRVEEAAAIARDLLSLAPTAPTPIAPVVGHTAYGISCWHRGAITDAAHHLDLAAIGVVSLAPDVTGDPLVGLNQLLLPIPFGAYIHTLAGDLDDPEVLFEQIVRRVPGDRYWELLVMDFAASGAISTGDFSRAERCARRGIAADPEGIAEFWSASARFYLGTTLCLQGDLDDGLPLLDTSWERYAATGQRTNGLTVLSSRAQALATAGRLDEAAAAVDLARQELEVYRELFAEPALRMAEAALLHARGERGQARAVLDDAFTLATSQGAHGVARRVRATAEDLGLS